MTTASFNDEKSPYVPSVASSSSSGNLADKMRREDQLSHMLHEAQEENVAKGRVLEEKEREIREKEREVHEERQRTLQAERDGHAAQERH